MPAQRIQKRTGGPVDLGKSSAIGMFVKGVAYKLTTDLDSSKTQRLTPGDVNDSVCSLPLCYEHDPGNVVGRVMHYDIRPDGSLEISAVLMGECQDVEQEIRSKEVTGFSVMYELTFSEEKGFHNKELREVSVVRRPEISESGGGYFSVAHSEDGGKISHEPISYAFKGTGDVVTGGLSLCSDSPFQHVAVAHSGEEGEGEANAPATESAPEDSATEAPLEQEPEPAKEEAPAETEPVEAPDADKKEPVPVAEESKAEEEASAAAPVSDEQDVVSPAAEPEPVPKDIAMSEEERADFLFLRDSARKAMVGSIEKALRTSSAQEEEACAIPDEVMSQLTKLGARAQLYLSQVLEGSISGVGTKRPLPEPSEGLAQPPMPAEQLAAEAKEESAVKQIAEDEDEESADSDEEDAFWGISPLRGGAAANNSGSRVPEGGRGPSRYLAQWREALEQKQALEQEKQAESVAKQLAVAVRKDAGARYRPNLRSEPIDGSQPFYARY